MRVNARSTVPNIISTRLTHNRPRRLGVAGDLVEVVFGKDGFVELVYFGGCCAGGVGGWWGM